jgi:hypothetical protein
LAQSVRIRQRSCGKIGGDIAETAVLLAHSEWQWRTVSSYEVWRKHAHGTVADAWSTTVRRGAGARRRLYHGGRVAVVAPSLTRQIGLVISTIRAVNVGDVGTCGIPEAIAKGGLHAMTKTKSIM